MIAPADEVWLRQQAPGGWRKHPLALEALSRDVLSPDCCELLDGLLEMDEVGGWATYAFVDSSCCCGQQLLLWTAVAVVDSSRFGQQLLFWTAAIVDSSRCEQHWSPGCEASPALLLSLNNAYAPPAFVLHSTPGLCGRVLWTTVLVGSSCCGQHSLLILKPVLQPCTCHVLPLCMHLKFPGSPKSVWVDRLQGAPVIRSVI
jgi:hypothetical protein